MGNSLRRIILAPAVPYRDVLPETIRELQDDGRRPENARSIALSSADRRN